MSDLLHQNYGDVQSDKQPQPVTVASAATVTPTTKLTFVTGTVQVATITPAMTGYHVLYFCFTNGAPGALLTSGNIKTAYTPITNLIFGLHYNPVDGKWWTEAQA